MRRRLHCREGSGGGGLRRLLPPLLILFASTAAAQTVPLDVSFKLTDLDYKPLSNVPVRIVFASDSGWQGASAGRRIVTDAKGEAHFTANVAIDRKLRKLPTNFVDSLFSTPKSVDHLLVGAEMEYMNFHWLYVVEVVRFQGGDTMLDRFAVYTRDTRGSFTRQIDESPDGFKPPELGGLVLTSPGYQVFDYLLERDQNRWKLRLAFRKSPPPIRR